jgi:hypothetical protein
MSRKMLLKSTRFGLLAGAIVAVIVSSAMTLWDWLENPGGIFRGPDGTRWDFVLETLCSWLIPGFAWAALIALLGHLALSRIRRVAADRQGTTVGDRPDAGRQDRET